MALLLLTSVFAYLVNPTATAQQARPVEVEVTIERVKRTTKAGKCLDFFCKPDFYAKVDIEGKTETSSIVSDDKDIRPNWTFKRTVNTAKDDVHISFTIWDWDAGKDEKASAPLHLFPKIPSNWDTAVHKSGKVKVWYRIEVEPSARVQPRGEGWLTEYPTAIRWGGRSVAVDVHPEDRQTALVATDSGGLFKTTDGGDTWSHVDGLPPLRMSDVKYHPRDPSLVIATVKLYARTLTVDGQTVSGGGIWRSTDGGNTWEKTTWIEGGKPASDCRKVGRPGGPPELRANGIAFEPDSDNVYVGFDCGVAISNDKGKTWKHKTLRVPAGGRRRNVKSVISPKNGVVYACAGADTAFKYDKRTADWTQFSLPKAALCDGSTHSLAASPIEPDVLFTVANPQDECPKARQNRTVYESDDGGESWTALFARCERDNARGSFVVTSPSYVPAEGDAPEAFDVYFGASANTYVHRGCYPNQRPSCAFSWHKVDKAHDDQMQVAFPTGERCPLFMVDDGGVSGTEDCGDSWENVGNAANGFRALQLYGVWGQIIGDHTDLYMGTQDNWNWGYDPEKDKWNHAHAEGGSFSMQRKAKTHQQRVITGYGFSGGFTFKRGPHFKNYPWTEGGWNDPPGAEATVPWFINDDVYVQWGGPIGNLSNNNDRTLYISNNRDQSWSPILTLPNSVGAVDNAPRISGSGYIGGPNPPTLYNPVKKGGRGGNWGVVKINPKTGSWSFVGQNAGTDWKLDMGRSPRTFFWREVLAVDPSDPSHLIAPDRNNKSMVFSEDGGETWQEDEELTDLVTRNDAEFLWGGRGGSRFSQVSAIDFDPENGDRILVGTENNGIIASLDGGENWFPIPGSEKVPRPTRFFFDSLNDVVYVASWGRGLWKLELPNGLDPDLFEAPALHGPNDSREEATPLDDYAMHNMFSRTGNIWHDHTPNIIGQTQSVHTGGERWGWEFGTKGNVDPTLHSPSDQDFYKITIPDPSKNMTTHTGLPTECGSYTGPNGGDIFVRASLTAWVKLEKQSGDEVRIYDPSTGREYHRVNCPRSNGMTEAVISVGERDDLRTALPSYELRITYTVQTLRLPPTSPADQLPDYPGSSLSEDVREQIEEAGEVMDCTGNSVKAVDPPPRFDAVPSEGVEGPERASTPSGGGGFPYCREPIEMRHQGGERHHAFHWQRQADLKMRFRTDSGADLSFQLQDAQGEVVATAQSDEEFPSLKQMTAENLEAGFYLLKVEGEESQFSTLVKSPPPPEDSDQDGVSDYFETLQPEEPRGPSGGEERRLLERILETAREMATGRESLLILLAVFIIGALVGAKIG